jgi:hypothetical protein
MADRPRTRTLTSVRDQQHANEMSSSILLFVVRARQAARLYHSQQLWRGVQQHPCSSGNKSATSAASAASGGGWQRVAEERAWLPLTAAQLHSPCCLVLQSTYLTRIAILYRTMYRRCTRRTSMTWCTLQRLWASASATGGWVGAARPVVLAGLQGRAVACLLCLATSPTDPAPPCAVKRPERARLCNWACHSSQSRFPCCCRSICFIVHLAGPKLLPLTRPLSLPLLSSRRLDGSKVLKVLLDPKDRNSAGAALA